MILVAYSGAESRNALDWAAEHALRTNQNLTVLTVIKLPSTLYDETQGVPAEFTKAARRVLDDAVARVRSFGVTDIETVIGYRDITGAIVELSREAEIVVVGNRGHGETASALLGSVAYAVTSHAACPVIVVRDQMEHSWGDHRKIVVGIDGSRAGRHAGLFAAGVAAQTGAELTVVGVWDIGGIGHMSGEFAARIGVEDLHAKGELKTKDWIQQAVRQIPARFPDVKVTGVVRRGSPVVVLREEAADASLLVIGSRGRGGFAGLLLGSVSHRLIHDVGCPVAVVR
ncbi:MAG: universal stress protein UspA [Micrococcales bacterium]|nr:MAG: universal stress protein UspA [Micrococcales bacterium]PIE27651.1 MAG: universal stress protein UspA [Micrococcales bacterium]